MRLLVVSVKFVCGSNILVICSTFSGLLDFSRKTLNDMRTPLSEQLLIVISDGRGALNQGADKVGEICDLLRMLVICYVSTVYCRADLVADVVDDAVVFPLVICSLPSTNSESGKMVL